MAVSERAGGGPDSVTRARDIDRAQASTMLDAAYAEGQLGADEYHDRSARAGTARTLGDLARLTADLQAPAVFGGPPTVARKRFGRKPSGTYPSRIRARDIDRAAAGEALDAARADGQLDAEEHAVMSELANTARTLGDLADLVAELQQRPAPPTEPPARNTFLVATVAVALAVAIAGFAVAIRDGDPPPVVAVNYDAASPRVIFTPPLTTLVGFLQFRDDYRATFADTLVDQLVLHENNGSVTRVAPGKANWTVDYNYRGGFARPNSQITTRQRDAVAIDLAQVNTDALGAALTNAATTLRVPDGKVSHFSIANDRSTGRPVITIHVGNEVSQSGYQVLALSGEVLQTHPNQK
ncbi:DUF1707 SHOCT-like domain-containing protein [Nocardia sp. NPDC055029]